MSFGLCFPHHHYLLHFPFGLVYSNCVPVSCRFSLLSHCTCDRLYQTNISSCLSTIPLGTVFMCHGEGISECLICFYTYRMLPLEREIARAESHLQKSAAPATWGDQPQPMKIPHSGDWTCPHPNSFVGCYPNFGLPAGL